MRHTHQDETMQPERVRISVELPRSILPGFRNCQIGARRGYTTSHSICGVKQSVVRVRNAGGCALMNSLKDFLSQMFLSNRAKLLIAHHTVENLVITFHSLNK